MLRTAFFRPHFYFSALLHIVHLQFDSRLFGQFSDPQTLIPRRFVQLLTLSMNFTDLVRPLPGSGLSPTVFLVVKDII